MICPKCGKMINDGDTFCAFCGETISAGNAAPQPQPPQQTQFYPPPAQQNVPYQNPTQQPQQFYPQPPVPVRANRTSPALIVVIILMVILLLAAIFVLFIKPGYLLKSSKNDSSSKGDTSSSAVVSGTDTGAAESSQPVPEQSSSSGAASETSVTTTTAPETSSVTETTTAPATTTTQETTTKKTTTTQKQTTTKKQTTTTKATEDKSTQDKNRIYEEAMSMSTYARPTFDEFWWCYGQNGFIYTPPTGADMINDPLGYSGGWKAMVIYNPSNMAGTYMRELDNIDIGVYSDSCTITIDWYYMEIDSTESYNEEDMADSNFFGYVTNTGLYASGDADISLNYLWKEDGKEYALGTIITSDGLPAYLAMVRP